MGEELLGALKSRLGNLWGGGIDGDDEGLEEGVGSCEWEAEERRGVGDVRGIGEAIEVVESGLAGGDEIGVLPPRGVLDDLVESGPKDTAGTRATPEGLEERHKVAAAGETKIRSEEMGTETLVGEGSDQIRQRDRMVRGLGLVSEMKVLMAGGSEGRP